MNEYDEIGLRTAAARANGWLFNVFDELARLQDELNKEPERWENECIGWDDEAGRPIVVKRATPYRE